MIKNLAAVFICTFAIVASMPVGTPSEGKRNLTASESAFSPADIFIRESAFSTDANSSQLMEASPVKANSDFLSHRRSLQKQPVATSMQTATERFEAKLRQRHQRMRQIRQDLNSEKTTMPSAQKTIMNVAPVRAQKLLWIFGCSLDTHAFENSCNSAGSVIYSIVPGTNAWSSSFPVWQVAAPSSFIGPTAWTTATKACTVDGITMFFTFQPGATPPPPWTFADLNFQSTAEEIAKLAAAQMLQTFGGGPDAIVMDSSVWDVAGWWVKDGAPQYWPFPSWRVQEWSDTTVPNFLLFLSKVAGVPASHVGFRSAPPMTSHCAADWYWSCEGGKILDMMYSRITKYVDTATLQLFGKYHFLDYRKIVLSETQVLGGKVVPPDCVSAEPRCVPSHYIDGVHPGIALTTPYMAAVLGWVKGLV